MNLACDDWSALLRLLDEVLELPPAERNAWLAAREASLGALAPALRQLLDERRAIETGTFLQALPVLATGPAPAGLAMGQHIGPYALLRELGQGGMASVWLAERADGAHRREVALKLPWLGARARVIGERFARAEILSALTHPHIASVLDAGLDNAALARARVRAGRADHRACGETSAAHGGAAAPVPAGAAGGAACARSTRHPP
jgi:hypothetical protein